MNRRQKGTGGVREKRPGIFELKFDIGPDPVTGRRRSKFATVQGTRRDDHLHGLRHAQRHIQSRVRKLVRLRRMPHLTFKLDRSFKAASRVLAAIAEARRVDEARRVATSSPEEEGP